MLDDDICSIPGGYISPNAGPGGTPGRAAAPAGPSGIPGRAAAPTGPSGISGSAPIAPGSSSTSSPGQIVSRPNIITSPGNIVSGPTKMHSRLKNRPRGFLPGDTGAAQWGARNGVGAKEGKHRFHKGIKQGDNMSGPTEDYWTNPETGDVIDPSGDYVGNLENDF